ncbi:cupin domain-containing protein [Pseudoalteromonas sp. MMG007]|uniref:cupin domain-containing protein n=1 Tax=Pseudoalteromonas sp. MMG007 TaxID=2822684 RepID=UPI001B35B8F2|nr:cupin domain-containing protein [Pseudoalteromonas sp. MMG007]MBQ4857786.1 cupin domain-containing protein [Pseudoalteromonas sp. MMG007]
MKILADFSQRVVVHSQTLDWVASPMSGVDRRALDRVGEEVARATSIVRYAPGSEFSPHVHTGGEEFVVLEGVFQDEHGDFPQGSYIRNPPQSKHKPGSQNGCIIFVKLWQFQPQDRTHVRLQTQYMGSVQHATFKGLAITPLYKDDYEYVSLLHFEAGANMQISAMGGAELLVLEGEVSEQSDVLVKHSWLRLPINTDLNITAGKQGAKLWLKLGHLTDVDKQIARVQNV